MPRRLIDIIKTWAFTRETRSRLDLTGGLRCLPGDLSDGPARLQLPTAGGAYNTSQTLTAVTWLANPLNVKEWRGFQADVVHAYDDNGDALTFARYRVSDGVTTYWWNGAAWVTITGVAATGSITEVAQASHVDGETLVLEDADGTVVTFHYDVSGTFVPGGGYNATNVRLNISGATTASDVATIVRAAINGATLDVTAGGAAASIALAQDAVGVAGNNAILETVTAPGYAVAGFTGGVDAALSTDWNTEEQVSANIGTFPLTQHSIRFVINLYTTDETVTPVMYGVKVLYGSDISHQEDYITRSLIPDLKENIRGIARIILTQAALGATITLPATEVSYDVVDVDSVFDEVADPNHLVDLLTSYNSGTRLITLNAPVAANTRLFVQFVYRPLVALRTSRDFDELDRVPAINIVDVTEMNAQELKDDTVVNLGTGQGTRVYGGKMRDIEMTVQVIADKLVDYQRLSQDVVSYFTANPLLRSRGLDEEFTILVVEGLSMMTTVNSNDTHAGQLRVRILNAVFLERGSTEVFTVTRFNMIGDAPIGYHSLRVTIS